jgi:hypothetical protein
MWAAEWGMDREVDLKVLLKVESRVKYDRRKSGVR